MSQNLKGFTINEGFTDLGTISVNISKVENVILETRDANPEPPSSRTCLARIVTEDKTPVPDGIKVVFTTDFLGYDPDQSVTTYTSQDGFVGFEAPIMPTVKVDTDNGTYIKAQLSPPYESRQEECYLAVYREDVEGTYYTLSTEFGVKDGYLGVYTEVTSQFHKLAQEIEISSDVAAIYISKKGQTFTYSTTSNSWNRATTLSFTQFPSPANLVSVEEGIYQAGIAAGTPVVSSLAESFDKFSLELLNPEPYYFDANIQVYKEGQVDPIFEEKLSNFMPGDRNYKPVTVEYTPPTKEDESPTLDDVEAIGDLTFSTDFKEFLVTENLTTMKSLAAVGPIAYIIDVPELQDDDKKLQGYVDLYALTNNLEFSQRLISSGYTNLYDISNTPRSKFVEDITDEIDPVINIYKAGEIHYATTQQIKLLSNILAASAMDFHLEDAAYSRQGEIVTERNNYGPHMVMTYLNSCSCDDCKSGVSPFAYLTDLIKYAAAHIKKTGSVAYTPTHFTNFVTLLSNKFYQPYSTLPVTCDTLHDEYCRVRLVTEILEKFVIANSGSIPTAKINQLAADRKNYLQLTYNTLLVQAGTTFNEVRAVFTANDPDDKKEKAEKLSAKLGIPLYVPSTVDYAAGRLWLSFSETGVHELTANNLESIFGFRSTLRPVTTATPLSDMEKWRAAHLRDTWRSLDYPLSVYTREGVVNPLGGFVYQPNWMPLVDPDIIGLADMGYLPNPVVKSLWKSRKEQIDDFLSFFVEDASVFKSVVSDIQGKIVRVDNTDVSNHVIENDTVSLYNGSWVNFGLFSRSAVGTNTNFILKSGINEPALFEPTDTPPMVRYKRVMNVEVCTVTSTTTLDVTVNADILHALTGGYAKLQSYNGLTYTTYQTSATPGSTYYLQVIGYANNVATLQFVTATPAPVFFDGTLTFVYEVEVPLLVNQVYDPGEQIGALFTVNNWEYNYLTPVPTGFTDPLEYTVWLTPSWPSDITSSTNYGRLKQLRQIIQNGIGDAPIEDYLSIVTDDLHLDIPSFHRMMDLFAISEIYQSAPYTSPAPTIEEMYELASIFSNSAKQVYAPYWVKEEIEHVPTGATDPIILTLLASDFATGMETPAIGSWDPSLQTIPNTVIIDPQYINRWDIQEGIGQESIFDTYDTRKIVLDDKTDEYFAWLISYDPDAVEKALKEISTGSITGDYLPQITPYTSLAGMVVALQGTPFEHQSAATVAFNAFGMSAEQFMDMMELKTAYESVDVSQHPTEFELKKLTKLLVTAYKIKQLYPSNSPYIGWIEEEVTANIKYYEVLKMRLAPGRGDAFLRIQWQKTLSNWNQYPIVEPDIIGAENINSFVTGNVAHDQWEDNWNELYDTGELFDDIKENFNYYTIPTIPAATQREKFQKLICYSFFNTEWNDVDFDDHIVYFNAINEREGGGEDIRPRLAYYGVTINQYRTLRRVYELIESTYGSGSLPLIPSEYEEVWDIFLNIIKQKRKYGSWMLKQYADDIILCSDDFKEYTPATINFPLVNLPDTKERRYPQKAQKTWFNTLNSRNEIEQYNKEWWKNVLAETEDQTMPVMRDGLIRALGKECEPFDVTAERLAKMLFIETKDNCCVKHTRVSQAIETLQGFIFSLKSGIYDNYLSGFSLIANNFDEEWEWLGSYATWRAAMFTYLFPENILYPTLKRKQSPGFRKVAQAIQDSSRLTPEQACKLGKDYQAYFDDMQNLEIRCTVTAPQTTFQNDANLCCGEGEQGNYTDFFFAESRISGKRYWSSKLHYDYEKDMGASYGFWEELPVKDGCEILGCFPLPLDRSFKDPTFLADNALWLFYTYYDNDKLKFAYIQKNLDKPGSSWGEEIEGEEIPTEIGDKKLGEPSKIVACQSSIGWDWPSFIITYGKYRGASKIHLHLRYLDYKGEWETPDVFDITNNTNILIVPGGDVQGAIRHECGMGRYSLTVVFEKAIYTKFTLSSNWIYTPITDNKAYLGAFQSRANPRVVSVIYKTDSGIVKKKLNCTVINNMNVTTTTISLGYKVLEIAPAFSTYLPATFGFNTSEHMCIGALIEDNSVPFSFVKPFGLSITNTYGVRVQSADCIDDFKTRMIGIKNHMLNNKVTTSGSIVQAPNYIHTSVVLEYLKEAYYFVPMLLALDQQQRGQFEAALDWYRTIYDYTVLGNGPNRKIYYGLVSEESIQNVYNRPEDWLLDPLNPHLVAQTRANSYTKYTVMNIIQCFLAYADREYTIDTIESVPRARILYTTALELLRIKELKLAPSICNNLVLCFPDSISFEGTEWQNLFAVLQQRLLALNNSIGISNAKGDIVEIFATTGLSTVEKFTQAFEAIDDASTAYVSEDINTWLAGSTQMYSELFQYFNAYPDLQLPLAQYTQQSNSSYAVTLSNMLQVPVSSLETGPVLEKLDWLKTDRNITEAYEFAFADASGKQVFTGDKGFNPLTPSYPAWNTNLTYANATATIDKTPQVFTPSYFPLLDFKYCLPKNPVYGSLELKANLELYKIQNCRNIAGMVRELDVYAAATDGTTGIPMIGASGNLILPGLAKYKPSQYRFKVLIDRAKQITSQAQQLESQFLSAMEKRDAEYYNQLKARQDLQTAKATVKLQDLRVKQANDEKKMSELQLEKVEFTKTTYDTWIGNGYNGFEIASLTLLQVALGFQITASVAYFLGAAMDGVFVITKAGDGAANTGRAFDSLAGGLATQASIFSQIASYERRRQEWEYQRDVASHDIDIANQQIKISEDNIRIISQEREIAQLNTDHAQDTLEFLKNKFTNAELYSWMSNVLEKTYSYMLNLATSVAKTAEGQLYFERQEQAGPFILDDYWEIPGDSYMVSGLGTGGSDRRGLTGSARLLQDLYRLDQYAFDTDKRSLQMTKTISLAQNFPIEFEQFKETGILNFELTNKLFDYDFPGHYLRLVRSVKSTVVGLLPVYGGIKATLTAEPTSYTVIGGNTFQRIPIKRLDVDSIALTSPNSSNGLFEMLPVQGEMLNPFEGMGVESRWEFKMPKFSNRVDYEQIADVLITLEYTALDSFQYRYQVLQELDTIFSFNKPFSFKNNFPDQWFDLSNAEASNQPIRVSFKTKKEDFPQGFSEIRVGGRIILYFVREDGYTEEVEVSGFKYQGISPTVITEASTVNGIYTANAVTSALDGGSPYQTWILEFSNTLQNRLLFSEEKIKDILFVITCNGDIPTYPL